MTNVLLALIVLILLFGAATMRGLLGRMSALVLFVLVAFVLLIGLRALFGDDGLPWVLGITALAFAGMAIWERVSRDRQAKEDADAAARHERAYRKGFAALTDAERHINKGRRNRYR